MAGEFSLAIIILYRKENEFMNVSVIKIENHNPYAVSFKTNLREYFMNAASVEGIPTVEYVTLEELKFLNSQSKDIRTGNITINAEDRDEAFKALNIVDRGEYFDNDTIKDAIINPTAEGMRKLVGITDKFTFERVYAQFIGLKNNGEYDISNRVANVLERRFDEIQHRIFNTKITINEHGFKPKEDIEEVKKKNETLETTVQELQAQLAELKAMIATTSAPKKRKSKSEPVIEAENTVEVDEVKE